MSLLSSIFKKDGGEVSVDELRALDSIDLTALDQAVGVAQAERVDALIGGSDADVRAAEKRLAEAELAADRGKARKAELERRIIETELSERRDTLRQRRDAVAAMADDLAARLGPRYRELVGGLVDLFNELRDAEQAVREINAEITQAGVVGEGVEQVLPIEVRGQSDLHSILVWTQLRRFAADPSIAHWSGGAAPAPFTAIPPQPAEVPMFISSRPKVALS